MPGFFPAYLFLLFGLGEWRRAFSYLGFMRLSEPDNTVRQLSCVDHGALCLGAGLFSVSTKIPARDGSIWTNVRHGCNLVLVSCRAGKFRARSIHRLVSAPSVMWRSSRQECTIWAFWLRDRRVRDGGSGSRPPTPCY